MVVGERSLLQVPCQLAYGQEGCFSFPHVPGGADLAYEVELVGFDEAKEVGRWRSRGAGGLTCVDGFGSECYFVKSLGQYYQ